MQDGCGDPTVSRENVLETGRLTIRTAAEDDADMFFSLWTDPSVMGNVGFPSGLRITREGIIEQLRQQCGSVHDRLLVVVLKSTGDAIGECRMHHPDREGIARTDIKLLPRFWGNRYGVEVKKALLSFLFTHTDCLAVEATPNVENTASIRMQEEVGGVRIGEGVYSFPIHMRDYTRAVHHYVYRVYRSDPEE